MRRQKDGDGWSGLAKTWLRWRQAHGVHAGQAWTIFVDGYRFDYDPASGEVSCNGRVVEDRHGPCDRAGGEDGD